MADLNVGYAADGTPKTYTSVAAAFSAASTGDNLRLYYADAAENRFWKEAVSNAATTKVVGLEGMVGTREIVLRADNLSYFYRMDGDLSASGSQVTFRNLVFMAIRGTNAWLYWNDTTGGGQGYLIDSCAFYGGYSGMYVNNGDANVCETRNSLFVGLAWGINILNAAAKAYYCTAVGCGEGFDGGGQASTFENCAAAWCYTNDYTGTDSMASFAKCASTDNTGSEASLRSKTPDDLDFWFDNDNGFQVPSWRSLTSSDLYHAGGNVAGITTDCDGTTRHVTTPSIGWHEGTASAYPSGATAANRPGVTAADDEDGTNFTLTIDGDAERTHQVWYRAWGTSSWSDGGTRVGDGTRQIAPGGTGLYEYLVATQNANGIGYGPAERGWVWVTDGDTSTEIQDALVATLNASSALTTALGGSGRIYEEAPAQGRVLPCVNYRLDGAINPALGAGTRELRLEMDIWAAARAKTREVEEVLDGILNDHSYDTTHWRVRLLARSAGASRAMNRSEDGDPIYCRRLAWRVYVRPIGS